MNTKITSTIISTPIILQNGVSIMQLNKLKKCQLEYPSDHKRILEKVSLSANEIQEWKKVADNMYFPTSKELGIYLQQDGFLDKDLVPVKDLDRSQRPINQKWSWDRVLRSPYIKQADVLQCFYFFEDHFSKEELERNFDFYESFTVHESSLSPCVHSIQAAVFRQNGHGVYFLFKNFSSGFGRL